MSDARGLDVSIAVGAYAAAAALHFGLLATALHFGGSSAPAEAAGRIELVTLPPQAAIAATPAAFTDSATSGDGISTVAAVLPSPQRSAASSGGLLTLLPVDSAGPSPTPAATAPATAPVVDEIPPTGKPSAPSRPAAPAVDVAPSPALDARPLADTGVAPAAGSSSAPRPTLRAVGANSASSLGAAAKVVDSPDEASLAPSPAGAIQRPSAPAVPRAAVATRELPARQPARSPAPIRPREQTAVAPVGGDTGRVAAGTSADARTTSGVAAAPAPSSGRAETARPLGPVGPGGATAVGTSQRVAAIAPRVAPAASGSAAAVGSTGEGRAVRDFLRFYSGGGCFIAVATQVERDRFAVSGFSRTAAEWTAFNRALDLQTGYRFVGGSRQVSDAQCAALAFARRQPDYPAFATRISLESDRLASGAEIAGRIAAPPDRRLTLLLVDDEGRVQDVSRLLGPAGDGGIVFRTPLTLTAGPVATVQLFVALASDGAINAVPADGSLDADTYFARLSQALEARKESVDVALAAFSVE